MDVQLGKEGTEQFVVEVTVDGKIVKTQAIHDPFVHNTTTVWISRWDHFKAIFKQRKIIVQVSVQGSPGAQRAVMTLNPEKLAADTREILEERRTSREGFGDGTIGAAVAQAYRDETFRL
jgi:hypothetical protein